MKKSMLVVIVLVQLFTSGAYAQRQTAKNQAIPREVPFEKLSDFVNDSNSRRNGERITVRDVPTVTEVTFEKAYRMYYFKPTRDSDVGSTFFMSAALAISLRPHLNSDAASMWVTCTLIEFVGEFDVYRSLFATKIEGLDESGETIWTVTGKAPLKLRIRQ